MTAPVAVKVDHAPVERSAVLVLGNSVSVRNDSEQIDDHPHRRTTGWKAAR
ncbi:hypothetical protein QWJ26_12465 [Streptomyces sp. CSDS2]|uniref:hypothetical protein n=1 Tax=Streptomyces sp. CSDS2 TaxID=3055051 RepID=UPI0025AFFFAB|nr:hypothetical protein [Streptomyces sp. CSDS2]MDN3260613.1 hypothetical protein [Streptomyces sp. CSDS2]